MLGFAYAPPPPKRKPNPNVPAGPYVPGAIAFKNLIMDCVDDVPSGTLARSTVVISYDAAANVGQDVPRYRIALRAVEYAADGLSNSVDQPRLS